MNNANLLIGSKSTSLVGTTIFNISINLWVVSVFGSSSDLGKVMAVSGISTVMFNLIGGYIGDAWNKSKIMKNTELFSFLFCIVSSFFISENSLWTVMIIVFLLNMNSAISAPVVRSMIQNIVKKEELIRYNSKLSQSKEIIKVGVPILTTFLFGKGIIDIKDVFLINAFSYLLSYAMLRQMKVQDDNRSTNKKKNGYLEAIFYLKSENVVFLLMITSLISNFVLAGFNLILPVFSTEILHQKEMYGIFIGAESVGALIGVFSSNFISIDKEMLKERIGLMFSGMILSLPFFYQSGILLMIICFCINLFLSRYNIAFQSYLQTHVPKNMTSKVFSISYLFAGFAVPLGSLVFGYLGEIWTLEIFLILSLGLVSINGYWILYMSKSKLLKRGVLKGGKKI